MEDALSTLESVLDRSHAAIVPVLHLRERVGYMLTGDTGSLAAEVR